MKYLVTGVAGFIGMHTAKRLLELGHEVIGIDNINDYYDQNLKWSRLSNLMNSKAFVFKAIDLADAPEILDLFKKEGFQRVIHLGAQAGVRYSLVNPMAYIDSNIVGTINVLEGCRHSDVEHLIYASSSSVYGNRTQVPFCEDDRVDSPISLYAATKKSNELMAYSYSHLYKLASTGLRFFTVYGPWGRPDMAPWLFTEAITRGDPIKVFNNGDLLRDFTYIDDIVEGIIAVQAIVPTQAEGVPYNLFNIGNNKPEKLEYFIKCLEDALGIQAKKIYLPMQDGDVYQTFADVSRLNKFTGFQPTTDLRTGALKFVNWYSEYMKNRKQK